MTCAAAAAAAAAAALPFYLPQLAAVNVLMEMSRPEEFWQPFFKTLPQPGEVVSPLVSMPAEYLPLLQSEPLVSTDGKGSQP